MKRTAFIVGALLILTSLIAGPAAAGGGNEWHVDPHGHVKLLHIEIEDLGEVWSVSFEKCVEVAAGKALRGPAHHHSIHTGRAGGSPFAQGALWNAGHAVVPLAPYGPPFWTGCESFTSPFIVPAP